jgi:hypothetical protein
MGPAGFFTFYGLQTLHHIGKEGPLLLKEGRQKRRANRRSSAWNARDADMGDRFRAEAGSDGKSAVTQAAGRSLSLTFYLEHIQE